MGRTRKILLIGASGYEIKSQDVRVDCIPWYEITNLSDLRDYDVIVVDLLSLATPHQISSAHFSRIVNFRSIRDVLKPGGSVIVIGDPRFTVRNDGSLKEPFLKWTGVEFSWDSASGDTVIHSSHPFHHSYEGYLKHLTKWDYSLRSTKVDSNALGEAYDLGKMKEANIEPEVVLEKFSWNRYGNSLAFSVAIRLRTLARSEPVEQLGPVIFLPKVELAEDEAIVLVLRDLCRIEFQAPEPGWAERYIAPGQDAVDKQIASIRAGIKAGVQSLRLAQTERDNVRKCVRLLYDQGSSLEEVVKDVLRELGAEVENPENPGQEDGWIAVKAGDQILEGVLEIKSTRNPQFGLEGIRQLLDWINRGVETRGRKYKGVFVGLSSIDMPPDERPDPFSSQWRKSAELHQIVALRAEDLFALHVRKAARSIDVEEFWRNLFETNGVFARFGK